MCGIAGTVDFKNTFSQQQLAGIAEKMSLLIKHRGPDDAGVLCHANLALAHRRLSIIDLGNGHQPLCNEDGKLNIVFNGEIYNYLELKSPLVAKGHIFKTNCDTEVLLHMYEEYGEKMLGMLNGMFAFAIYDENQNELFIACDRMGQKPLFYFRSKGEFGFCSELGALKAHPRMPRELRMQSLHDYFSLQYVPHPFTVYSNVYKLPPAHYLKLNCSSGEFAVKRYWRLDFSRKSNMSFDEAGEQLRELLTDSVKKRLMADVPYGAFLSGGIDSSIISALTARLCDHPLKVFTIGFDNELYDEREYAAIAVQSINKFAKCPLEHHEKVVKSDDFDVVKRLVAHFGEPYSDASMLPTFLLSEFTRENVTVALSGDGADELFAGYERYLAMKYCSKLDFLPASGRKMMFRSLNSLLPRGLDERKFIARLRRLMQAAGDNSSVRYLNMINRFGEKMKNSLYADAFAGSRILPTDDYFSALYSRCSAPDDCEKPLEVDIDSYLPGDILAKIDIASMANSLELRSPFMDYRVVEFAAALPFEFKQKGSVRKYILQRSFADMIPQQLRSRRKKGFGVPLADWFRNQWYELLRGSLLDGRAVKSSYIRRDAVAAMIKEHKELAKDNSYALWSLLIFELFLSNE